MIVSEIMDVRVIGGEPFMVPYLAEAMEHFLEDDRIKNFSIYTNATILPNEQMIKIMKHRKVKCEVSDYGPAAKNFGEFVKILEKEKIRYRIVKMEEWHQLGGLRKREISQENMKKVFQDCYCNNLLTMLKGKVYRCPYSAHGRELDAIPYHEEDVVDLYGTDSYVRHKLYYLIYRKEFDYACGYCSGRNYHLAAVEPAVQTRACLDYKKYWEE